MCFRSSDSNTEPLVSVCMITYNHALYICDAIEGVLLQKTNFSLELVIGEDCSTDTTREICYKYQERYPNLIKLLLRKENLGMKRNFIDTISACKGKYIALCEGDDYWIDPYKLQKQVDILEQNSEFGIVYTDIDIYYQNENTFDRAIFKNCIMYRTKNFEEHLFMSGSLAPCTWLFNRNLLSIIDYDLISTDVTFGIMLDFFQNTRVYYYDKVTAVYRVNDGSATRPSSEEMKYLRNKGVFDTKKKYLNKYNLTDYRKNSIHLDGYSSLFDEAINFGDKDFVFEALLFLKKNKKSDNFFKEYLSFSYYLYGYILTPLKALKKILKNIYKFIFSRKIRIIIWKKKHKL
jgi:glucosyltransferase